jgi:hypothetical protein
MAGRDLALPERKPCSKGAESNSGFLCIEFTASYPGIRGREEFREIFLQCCRLFSFGMG